MNHASGITNCNSIWSGFKSRLGDVGNPFSVPFREKGLDLSERKALENPLLLESRLARRIDRVTSPFGL